MGLPGGGGCFVVSVPRRAFLERWVHKLFRCPTFWRVKASFFCPECGAGYRCYWDGHDVAGVGIDLCARCAGKHESA